MLRHSMSSRVDSSGKAHSSPETWVPDARWQVRARPLQTARRAPPRREERPATGRERPAAPRFWLRIARERSAERLRPCEHLRDGSPTRRPRRRRLRERSARALVHAGGRPSVPPGTARFERGRRAFPRAPSGPRSPRPALLEPPRVQETSFPALAARPRGSRRLSEGSGGLPYPRKCAAERSLPCTAAFAGEKSKDRRRFRVGTGPCFLPASPKRTRGLP